MGEQDSSSSQITLLNYPRALLACLLAGGLQVKLIAINDAFILESNVFMLLKRHFGHEPYYLALLELFHQVPPTTCLPATRPPPPLLWLL